MKFLVLSAQCSVGAHSSAPASAHISEVGTTGPSRPSEPFVRRRASRSRHTEASVPYLIQRRSQGPTAKIASGSANTRALVDRALRARCEDRARQRPIPFRDARRAKLTKTRSQSRKCGIGNAVVLEALLPTLRPSACTSGRGKICRSPSESAFYLLLA